ncbi:reverse transcriptase domain-containing protein [Tanacetum coccineum]|uniref:Reverse transcriptase domain-containing protein n=1 Tax=Tanacetum coccineum TaxID=301880 RepID=A0ABQ5EHM3_9ASTR
MPFGLKNAGATYQRLVDKAFDKQVGRNLEVYVDDLVIKSHTEEELLRDIEETFRTLRKINMKLNPKKCTFERWEGMFWSQRLNEYEALMQGCGSRKQIGGRHIHSKWLTLCLWQQVLGAYVAKEENMVKYLEKTNNLVSGFDSFSISHVSRSKNKKADALSKIASTGFAHLSKQVLVEILNEKSINGKEVAAVVEEEEPTWMTPIVEYPRDEILLEDIKDASKLHIKDR